MTTALRIPNIALVESADSIASCNACGVQNYIAGIRGEKAYQSTGLKLWDLSYTMGSTRYVTKLCGDCVVVMRDALSAVANQWTRPASLVDTQETDADPEHNVGPRSAAL